MKNWEGHFLFGSESEKICGTKSEHKVVHRDSMQRVAGYKKVRAIERFTWMALQRSKLESIELNGLRLRWVRGDLGLPIQRDAGPLQEQARG